MTSKQSNQSTAHDLIRSSLKIRTNLAIAKLKPLIDDSPESRLMFAIIKMGISDLALPLFSITAKRELKVHQKNLRDVSDSIHYIHSDLFDVHASGCGLEGVYIRKVLRKLKVMV